MTVKLEEWGQEIEFKKWNFPGGEVGVKIESFISPERVYTVKIVDIPTSEDIMTAMNLLNALYRAGVPKEKICLDIPYFPYARQDRKCHAGESFALEVFIQMICSLPYYGHLIINDPHSKVTTDLLEQYLPRNVTLTVFEQYECMRDLQIGYRPAQKFDFIIAPDEGAFKKSQSSFRGTPHIYLTKIRQDGKVIYQDYAQDTLHGNILVIDDICDGGATFIALAEMLRRTQPRIENMTLYTTHGIYSKGTEELDKYYSSIYTANLMNKNVTGVKEL